MGDLTKVKYSARSIAKEEDFNYGETVEIENLSILVEQMIQSTNNFIINGGEISQRSTPSMNVEVASVIAFNKATGKLLYSNGVTGPIAVTNGGAADRIDLLEIRSLETDYDTKVRAFKDPATGAVSYNSIDTKTRYEIEAQIIAGVEGSGNAPSVTAGWVKLAEISVAAGESTSILNADITNCTATQDGETNTGWTTDTTNNYRLKGMSELKTMFRVKHEENGDHKDDVIKAQHIDWGAGTDQVDADLIPLGTAITSSPTGGTATNLTTASLIRTAIQEVFSRLIDLSGVQNDAVDSRHIHAGAIDLEHMSNNSVDSDQYVDGSIDDIHLSSGIQNEMGANTTHRSSTGVDHSDVVLNNTHRTSDGKNHSDVVLNNTHRGSTGVDHEYIDQDVKTTARPTFAGVSSVVGSGSYAVYGCASAIGIYGYAATLGVFGRASYCGVTGCADTSRPVVGNGAYYNTSTKYLKQPTEKVCLINCLLKNPLPVYKWRWEDENQRGFDEFVSPYAQDLQKTFGLTEKNDGYYTMDGIALGLGIELLKEIQFLKKRVKKLEELNYGN